MAKEGTLFGKPRSQVIKRPGALIKKAQSAGKTVSQFCAALGPQADTRTKQQCNLAAKFAKWRRQKK